MVIPDGARVMWYGSPYRSGGKLIKAAAPVLPERPDGSEDHPESQWTVWEAQTRQMADYWQLAYDEGLFQAYISTP